VPPDPAAEPLYSLDRSTSGRTYRYDRVSDPRPARSGEWWLLPRLGSNVDVVMIPPARFRLAQSAWSSAGPRGSEERPGSAGRDGTFGPLAGRFTCAPGAPAQRGTLTS
jgi:hypothetical protein